MILLDTHIWIWWVQGDPRLTEPWSRRLSESEMSGLGVSIISCWEVAKLVEKKRLQLPCTLEDWMQQALGYPGIQLLDLTARIVCLSTQLAGEFHRDPADQLIVATAKEFDCPLLTVDERIRSYPHVKVLT